MTSSSKKITKKRPAVKSIVIRSLTHYNVNLQDKNGLSFRQSKDAIKT